MYRPHTVPEPQLPRWPLRPDTHFRTHRWRDIGFGTERWDPSLTRAGGTGGGELLRKTLFHEHGLVLAFELGD